MFLKLLDTAITWALYWGIWLLAVLLFRKDFATDGPIGFALTCAVGFAAAYITKPIMAKFARYLIGVVIFLVWWGNISLMSH